MKTPCSWLALVAFTATLAAQAQPGDAPADVIYSNGTFITMSEERPTASAVAIRGDRFVAVGTVKVLRHQ